MDDPAHPVQVVKADEDLFGHTADKRHRNSFVVVALHDLKQVDAEDLEDHDEVLSIGAIVQEGVEQLHCVTVFHAVATLLRVSRLVCLDSVDVLDPFWFEGLCSCHIQDLHFVVRGLLIV